MNRFEKRKERFNDIVCEIEEKGYVMNFEKISLVKMNVLSLILMIVSFICFLTINMLIHEDIDFQFSLQNYIIVFLLFIVCAVIHEGLHALTAHFVGHVSFYEIEFGIMKGNPYCYILAQLSKKQYMIFALVPSLFLGMGFGIIGICMNNIWILILASFNLSGGAGDIYVSYRLVKQKCAFVMDHPNDIGYVYFEKI